MTKTKWITNDVTREQYLELANRLNISPILSKILFLRNIKNLEDAKVFLNPSLDFLEKKNKIPNIIHAAEEIKKDIQENKKILVYGDYDVDGITGTSLVVNALKKLGANVAYYIPHRHKEGYGLNTQAIHKFIKDKVDTIITIDCGISNITEIELAKANNINVIVLDHHTPPEVLPDTIVVDPKMGEVDNPFFNVAGVTVGYLFCSVLYEKAGTDPKILTNQYLNLVALGTIADVVPLDLTNRALAFHGINQLNQNISMGINYLKSITGTTKVKSYTIGYVIGPRINAAGRVDHASLAVDLLLTKKNEDAETLANQLNNINERRKEIGLEIYEEAVNKCHEQYDLNNTKSLVITGKEWHPGIIGIVASQVTRDFNKPAVMITVNGDIARGSARSINGIDIYTPLSKCKELFINFGGHKEAAGFSIKTEMIPAFQDKFLQIMNQVIQEEDLKKTIEIDHLLKPHEVTLTLAKEMSKLEPFGKSNSEPVFCTKKLYPIDYKSISDDTHLTVTFSDGMRTYKAIGFGMADRIDELAASTIDVCYHLKINSWRGNNTVQLQIIDFKESIEE